MSIEDNINTLIEDDKNHKQINLSNFNTFEQSLTELIDNGMITSLDQLNKIAQGEIRKALSQTIRMEMISIMRKLALDKSIVDADKIDICTQAWYELAKIKQEKTAGITVVSKDGGYWKEFTDKNGIQQYKQLTNFLFENIRKTVTSQNEHIMIVDINYASNISLDVLVDGGALSSIRDFRALIKKRSGAMLMMEITPEEFGALILFIESLPFTPVVTIPYLGIHYHEGTPFFAYVHKQRNGYNEQKVVKILTPDGVELNHSIYYEEIDQLESKFSYVECSKQEWIELTRIVLNNFPYINKKTHMLKILSWFMSSPLKHLPYEKEWDYKFPHLHVAGTPGSGKTTILEFITRLFGYVTSGGSFTKKFVTVKNMAESNSQFHWIDEYKVDSKYKRDSALELADLLRKNYDCGLEERGTQQQTKNMYKLVAPTVCSGESEFTDTAVLERTIQLIFSSQETESEYKDNQQYAQLKQLKGISKFALNYHKWLLNNHNKWQIWVDNAVEMVDKFKSEDAKSRTQKSMVWVVVGMLILQELAQEVGADMELYSDSSIESLLSETAILYKEHGHKNSLEHEFVQFLAENWDKGLTDNDLGGKPSVRMDNGIMAFKQALWIKRFQRHCAISDRGPQQDNIIQRTIKELERTKCIAWSNQARSIGGKTDKSFGLDTKQAGDMYGIEDAVWYLEKQEDIFI